MTLILNCDQNPGPAPFLPQWYLCLFKLLDTKGTEAEEMKEKGIKKWRKANSMFLFFGKKEKSEGE